MQLRDKVIMVTGAAGGIGRAMCERFAADGPAALIMLDVDGPAVARAAAGVEARAYPCDVTQEAEVRRIVQEVEREFRRVDLFCANAGVSAHGGEDVPDAVWRHLLDVNFMSHVYSARAVLPGMLRRGEGYLLHTASAAGLLTQMGSAPYAVSKHAAVAFAEWLSITYADRGIGVSCLCPQGVWTDMLVGEDPVLAMLRETALTPEHVAECVVQALAERRFLVLPHPEVADYFRHKATDYERWLGGMRKLQRQLSSPPSDMPDSPIGNSADPP